MCTPAHMRVCVSACLHACLPVMFLRVSKVSQPLDASVASHFLLATKRDDVDQRAGQEIIK